MGIEVFFLVLFLVLLNIVTGFKKSSILNCGLVGFSGSDGSSFSMPLVKTMLWYNSLTRGKHATGIFTPSMGIIKSPVEAIKFFEDKQKMALFEENDNYLLGHVRAATVGDASNPDAAHPWDFGDIVMMHNGTLLNHEKLASDYGIKPDEWVVDSQVLGMCIQQNFKSGNPFKVLNEYLGAAAVVVYHKERNSLFVYRDQERPLFYGYLDNNIYISSLEDVLKGAGCSNVKSFEEFKVHEIKDGKILSKLQITRSKARKNDIISNIVTSVKDIVKYLYYQTDKICLNNDFRGFARKLMKAKYFENYYIKAVTTTAPESNLAKITNGCFYKFTRDLEGNKFIIKDDKGEFKEVFIDFFDYENFIPTAGSYVVALGNHMFNQAKIGDIYEVIYHRFGFDTILIRDHHRDTVVQSTISNFRVATEKELNSYFKEPKSCTIIDLRANENKEEPIVSDKDDVNELLNEIVKDAIENNEEKDEDIEIRDIVIKNFMIAMSMISIEVSQVLDEYNEDIPKEAIERMEDVISVSKKCSESDSNFILNFNENSMNNI